MNRIENTEINPQLLFDNGVEVIQGKNKRLSFQQMLSNSWSFYTHKKGDPGSSLMV